jgi:hypothetical protein
MRSAGLTPRAWGNGPGDRYGWHRHDYHKVLYCVEGAIVFHTRSEGDSAPSDTAGLSDIALGPGDRLDIPPGIDHAATVGAAGVRCIEAPVSGASPNRGSPPLPLSRTRPG